eukprot:g5886.t1
MRKASIETEFLRTGPAMETISAQVDILNDEESTRKERVKALVVLSNLAIEEDNRDDLLDGIRQLSDTFENALIEKEEGSKNFSTKVGDMHQLVVLLFIRLMDYDFKTGDILDLFRYNFSLSLATIEISFKKVAYEDEVVLGLTRLLSGFAIPSTYFSGKGRQSMSERDCSEFSEKINMFVDKLRASQIISTWVSAVMRRVKKSKVGIQQVHCEMQHFGIDLTVQSTVYNSRNLADETSTNQEYPVATPVVLGLPSEFLCAMNGQCLKEPMRSKINRSLVFEKKTIEGWFERCGNVCPITSTPLKPSDLVYDDNLAKQITSFMIQQSYQKNNNNFADDDDMYSF